MCTNSDLARQIFLLRLHFFQVMFTKNVCERFHIIFYPALLKQQIDLSFIRCEKLVRRWFGTSVDTAFHSVFDTVSRKQLKLNSGLCTNILRTNYSAAMLSAAQTVRTCVENRLQISTETQLTCEQRRPEFNGRTK